jgi:hypothetical protein
MRVEPETALHLRAPPRAGSQSAGQRPCTTSTRWAVAVICGCEASLTRTVRR